MAIDFTPSWSTPELDTWRDSVRRFVETEVLPGVETARKLCHV